ncbi:uncharacterized lipoprotein YddW (UPF0748 family) [Allocatelliglobosispora scoriae]|uniref:Uncharacterized lipoprotein YddW (UPF0748 family) n=1 Tax=Allocatelliglobosispora scoriae TaxID=643052 RepID=A0A841BQF3_9ACTN|nr:family 10 glycosylhydrolase [Allocatelliglobosispora scoriae]MBB5869050.1 uncharacterized lipoprotein YddW (UPF0748 family) [Allocatelliglobosispora scoriae]
MVRLRGVLPLLLLAALGVAAIAREAPPVPVACTTNPATPKSQFRAMWISTVVNIDWPSAPGLSVAQQQAEYRSWLDLAVQRRMNAMVVQVRPAADAFWPSPLEPWSQWLTGQQGTAPGYDPLAFLVSEAHARNLDFHAWFNPYRVGMTENLTDLVAAHPARQHPGWTFAYGGKRYYNPGIPAVRDFVEDAMMDAVSRYDIDGVHWDDYFYPYPDGSAIPDQATFAQYGSGFTDIGDWRRSNVDKLVQEMGQRIKAAKPWVAFGISPFGIWRNGSTNPLGSATDGLQSYDSIYADTRKWVKQHWIDYITPQIYWHRGFVIADYDVLVPWWASVVAGTGVQLYVGQATYRTGASGQPAQWQTTTELTDHLFVNRGYPQVSGDIHFSAKDVRADRLGSVTRLAGDHYSRTALVPVNAGLGGAAPVAPSITSATRAGGTVTVGWSAAGGATAYAIYRLNGSGAAGSCAFADATALLGTTRSRTFTDTSAVSSQTYSYYVTALDRQHHESPVSAARVVAGGGPFSVIVDNATAGRFTASAAWGTSSFSDQGYGADYRFATPVSSSDVAWFAVDVPSVGAYKVEVWYPANAGYNAATPFIVATTTGNRSVTVNQTANGGKWVSLGTFTLAAGDRNTVGVSRWTTGTGYVVADAVRISS